MVNSIPAGYQSITPYLMVRDGERAIAFYREAFGAEEVMRFNDPNGRIAHADPFGHVWSIGTHREDVSLDEMQRRMAAMSAEKKSS